MFCAVLIAIIGLSYSEQHYVNEDSFLNSQNDINFTQNTNELAIEEPKNYVGSQVERMITNAYIDSSKINCELILLKIDNNNVKYSYKVYSGNDPPSGIADLRGDSIFAI